MRLFTVRVRLLAVFFLFAGFLLNNNCLPASKPRFFNASDNGTTLILSLTTPRAVDATAFPSLGNNGNKPLAIQSPYQKKMVQVFPGCPLCTFRLWKTHVLPKECTLEKNTI